MATAKVMTYKNFRGVDFSNKEVIPSRSPNSINMWKSYADTDAVCVETRPGMKKLGDFGAEVYGIYFYELINEISRTTQVLVHAGTKIYNWKNYPNSPVEKTIIYENINPFKSNAFVFNNIFYFKDGLNYLEYDGLIMKPVVGTIPLTTIGRAPLGGGTIYQRVNLIQPKRRNAFVADGKSKEFYLDATDLDPASTFICTAEVNGVNMVESINFEVDREKGIVTFGSAPEAPLSDGSDNVYITFSKTVPGYADRILKSNLLCEFDNRIFFSGNEDYPNAVFHTELNDPRFIADLNYYTEGTDFKKVKAMVPGNNALWVFKEPNQGNTTAFYHTPVIDDEYGKVYPSSHSTISTGCISTGINFNDDIVFFSERGMEGISGDIGSEQFLTHRSTLVDSKLTNEANYENMQLTEYNGYLLCLVNNHIYLADSRQKYSNTNDNSVEYEWYYWELPFDIRFLKEYRNKLFIITMDGIIYELKGIYDDSLNINSIWTLPETNFGSDAYLKTSNKRGGVAIVKKMNNDSITVKTKTSKEEEEEISSYSDKKGYIVYRIKKKKWSFIQFSFSSNKPFGLFSCTLEAFIGGYVKR